MRKKSVCAISLLLALLLAISLGTMVGAASPNDYEATGTDGSLISVMDLIERAEQYKISSYSDELDIKMNSYSVEIDAMMVETHLDVIAAAADVAATNISITMPEAPGEKVFETKENSSYYRVTDSGFVKYEISYGGEMNPSVIYAENVSPAIDGLGEADGSYLVYDSNGSIAGAIGIPKTYDATGREISTSTEIAEDGIVPNVILEDNSIVYPTVTITPFDHTSDFFSYYTGWRQLFDYGDPGCTSLGITPKKWGIISAAEKETRWNAVVNYVYWTCRWSYWSNGEGMRDQFMCHANWSALAGSEWNLEPARTGSASITNLCNPGPCP